MKTKLTKDKRTLDNFERRLDRQAIAQLRAEVVRLSEQIKDLESRLYWAEQDAMTGNHWQDIAIDLMNETGKQIGMTKDGEFGLLRKGH